MDHSTKGRQVVNDIMGRIKNKSKAVEKPARPIKKKATKKKVSEKDPEQVEVRFMKTIRKKQPKPVEQSEPADIPKKSKAKKEKGQGQQQTKGAVNQDKTGIPPRVPSLVAPEDKEDHGGVEE
jgi:hypothetical protein